MGFLAELLTFAGDVLLFEGVVESEVGCFDDDPANQSGDGGDIDKPSKYDRTVVVQD